MTGWKPTLHERLALESLKVSESLNTYVVNTLKKELGLSP